MADTTITIQEIKDQFGSYYLDGGQNEQDLRMKPFEKFGTKEAFHLVPTNDTILRLSEVDVVEILQGYQDTYTPKGGVEFKPIEIPLTQVKIDQEFNPNALVQSWLGFLTNNSVRRDEWPFIRWFIEKYILAQLEKDLEMKAIYNGSKVVPTPGTAGAAIEAMDGVKKQINAAITAGHTTPIALGEPPADPKDFCVYMEEFSKGIPEIYWGEGLTVNMSKLLHRRYREGRRLLYNINYSQVDDLDTIEDTNLKVVGRSSMFSASKIWATKQSNYVLGVKGFSNANMFEIEHAKRKVAIYTDFWLGIGPILKSEIFTNDVDLV